MASCATRCSRSGAAIDEDQRAAGAPGGQVDPDDGLAGARWGARTPASCRSKAPAACFWAGVNVPWNVASITLPATRLSSTVELDAILPEQAVEIC